MRMGKAHAAILLFRFPRRIRRKLQRYLTGLLVVAQTSRRDGHDRRPCRHFHQFHE
jgi:hypothetical protein